MSRDTLGGDDPFSGEPMGEPTIELDGFGNDEEARYRAILDGTHEPLIVTNPGAEVHRSPRHTCAVVQSASHGGRVVTLFRVTAEHTQLSLYLLVLEAPELGGAGHPLASLLSGHDALERGLAVVERWLEAGPAVSP